MKKQIFKVLDYIDENGDDQSLDFECNTPHVLILGNNLDDIVGLEKKMLKNLSNSNGKEINLIVIDDKSVLPIDFFDDLEFNHISRINEDEAITLLDGNLTQTFEDRYLMLYRYNEGNFTKLNDSGKGHLKMLVYFFPSISNNKKLHRALGRSGSAIQVGVHAIAGINSILDNPEPFDGCETRISFPAEDKSNDMRFFCKYLEELPAAGDIWFKFGYSGQVKAITLK